MPPRDKKLQLAKAETETETDIGNFFEYAPPMPVAEAYFSIPQDLESLENINVLDYLRQHVWLSSKRQRKCKNVFFKLTQFNSRDWRTEFNEWEYDDSCLYENNQTVFLPMVFLGVALVDLFQFPATHQNMTELFKYLEHDKLRFRELDFRTWCGVSAFAERMAYEGPLQCEYLEKADFKYLKTYGVWCDFSLPLQRAFNVIEKAHKNVFFCKIEDTLN